MAKSTPQHIINHIIQLYESGLSITLVQLEIGVSKPTISKILKKNNIKIRIDNYQSLDINWNIVNEEYDSGASTYDLAKRYNCSDETIRKNITNLRSISERNIRSLEIKQKISESCKQLWDDDNYIEKQREGFETWCKSDEAKETYKRNYEKSLGQWVKTHEAKEKLSQLARERWENPEIREKYLKSIANPSNINARIVGTKHHAETTINLRKNDFISKAKIIHNNKYDYSNVDFNNSMEHVEITCPIHGEFKQRPNHHTSLKNGCPSCPSIISKPHQTISDLIPSHIEYINNDRGALNGNEIDVYCPKINFGIEIHGAYWHSCRNNNQHRHSKYKKLHFLKADLAQENNISLYQFWDFEIDNNYDLIKSMVRNKLGFSNRIYARKCNIVKLKNHDVSEFFNNSHLQGHRNSSVIYACVIDGEIQCSVSFSKHPQFEWEIIRFACKPGTTVIGGFSKLLKRFVNDYNPTRILTFADRRFSIGGLYLKSGFKFLENTKPNYFYIKGNTLLSRQQCQKHKLSKLLGENLDYNLSEKDNMLNNGYGQVYDAGHVKLVWFENS